MNLADINGDIYLENQGEKILIANVCFGITYGIGKGRNDVVTRVTIYPGGKGGLSDIFLFYSNGSVPFHHIQTRDTVPGLRKVYTQFIAFENDRSLEAFISEVVAEYFVKKLGYTMPSEYLSQDLE